MVRNVQSDEALTAALHLIEERAARAGMPVKQYLDELQHCKAPSEPKAEPPSRPVIDQGSAEWIRNWREWAASHPVLDQFVDDSRESIYPDRI